MDMSQQIRDILSDIGYNLQDLGKEYRARPIYRDSDSNTVLRIRKDNGNWVDFKENISDIKFITNKNIKLSAKNKRNTTTILIRSQKIIIFFLLNLSAIRPANEERKAGIILATSGTTAVISEFPSVVPI